MAKQCAHCQQDEWHLNLSRDASTLRHCPPAGVLSQVQETALDLQDPC